METETANGCNDQKRETRGLPRDRGSDERGVLERPRAGMLDVYKRQVRKMILKDHKRPDGRAVDQIRPLAAEIDMLPRVHGSAMFTRGQTQILNICTLAPLSCLLYTSRCV